VARFIWDGHDNAAPDMPPECDAQRPRRAGIRGGVETTTGSIMGTQDPIRMWVNGLDRDTLADSTGGFMRPIGGFRTTPMARRRFTLTTMAIHCTQLHVGWYR